MSQHLAKLRMARLVRTRREGTSVFYQLENDHVRQLIVDAVHNAEHAGPYGPGAPPACRGPQRRSAGCGRRDDRHCAHASRMIIARAITRTGTARWRPASHRARSGCRARCSVPHSHDSADSVDSALEGSAQGIRAVKISLVVLGVTALLQLLVVAVSGSVALLADTVHNVSDALTAVPLWIAFALSGRAASRRYTYGYGRVEDLAGLFVVAMIALSAVIAGWEAISRLINPAPVEHLGWVAVAGVDRVRRQRTRCAVPDPGRAAASDPPRWSPTACTPGPTGSPRWPWWPARPVSPSAGRPRTRSSVCSSPSRSCWCCAPRPGMSSAG